MPCYSVEEQFTMLLFHPVHDIEHVIRFFCSTCAIRNNGVMLNRTVRAPIHNEHISGFSAAGM